MAKGDERPREPLVIISRQHWACADFGQLDFLPRGDTALTRRARRDRPSSPGLPG